MADFTDYEFDPVTGQTKKKQQLPYLNPNENSQGYLPYTAGNVQQGNTAVMGAAQTTALAPPPSAALNNQTTQMTQKLMNDPNMGRDFTRYNTGMMSKFDADRSSGIKQFKEANAGMGGSGNVQKNLVDLALSQNLDRGLYENELDQQAYEEGMKNYLSALGQGREQASALDTSQQSYINNLLNTRAAYEPERSQTSSQEFQAGQQDKQIASNEKIAQMSNDLTREVEAGRITMQEKELVQNATQFNNELDYKKWATQAGIDADTATRAWQTKERLETQSFNSIEANLDRQLDREIESGRLNIQEKELAQNAMQFADEMAFKQWAQQSQIDDATANRIWQSAENAKDQAHEVTMQTIQNEFAKQNVNMQAVLSMLESYPPETAAQIISQMAKDIGMTYTDEKGQVQQGLPGISKADVEKMQTDEASATAREIISGNINYKTLTGPDDPVYKAILANNQIPSTAGSVYTIEQKGINNDRHAYTEMEKAYTNKTPIRIGDKIYSVSSYTVNKDAGDNTTVYHLVNIIDSKDTKEVKAK